MDNLPRFSRADLDGLSRIELNAGGAAEKLFRDTEHQRMHDEIATLGRARDQAAGAAGSAPLELIRAGGSPFNPGAHLDGNLVHALRGDNPIDDHSAIAIDCGQNLFGQRVCIKMRDTHCETSLPIELHRGPTIRSVGHWRVFDPSAPLPEEGDAIFSASRVRDFCVRALATLESNNAILMTPSPSDSMHVRGGPDGQSARLIVDR